eukprot:4778117-Prymnesium_polylepis.1
MRGDHRLRGGQRTGKIRIRRRHLDREPLGLLCERGRSSSGWLVWELSSPRPQEPPTDGAGRKDGHTVGSKRFSAQVRRAPRCAASQQRAAHCEEPRRRGKK